MKVAAAAAVLVPATPAAGQDVLTSAARFTAVLECCQVSERAPMPYGGGTCLCRIPAMSGRQLSTPDELQLSYTYSAPLADVDGSPMAFRTTSRVKTYAVWGGLGGAVAGGIWGLALLATAEDWIGPSPFVVTVPAGAVAGALVGAAVGALAN
jgi:hypothetical protein